MNVIANIYFETKLYENVFFLILIQSGERGQKVSKMILRVYYAWMSACM